MLNNTFLFTPRNPRHVDMTTLFHDENIFHIRSFHASRRREPNSIDVLCAYYFLGCLILLYAIYIFVSYAAC
jgi:hypothetical protein